MSFIAFLELIDQIEKATPVTAFDAPPNVNGEGSPMTMHPVTEVRLAMEKLIGRMDSLQGDFDKLAERSSELTFCEVCVGFSCADVL